MAATYPLILELADGLASSLGRSYGGLTDVAPHWSIWSNWVGKTVKYVVPHDVFEFCHNDHRCHRIERPSSKSRDQSSPPTCKRLSSNGKVAWIYPRGEKCPKMPRVFSWRPGAGAGRPTRSERSEGTLKPSRVRATSTYPSSSLVG